MNNGSNAGRQKTVISLLCCLVYFVSYLTRLNYAAGLTGIQEALSLTKQQASLPVTGVFITYGIGQLVCGILGDRIAPRTMIFLGLIASSVCNLAAAATSHIGVLTALWSLNGFFQAMLWPPMVRIMAEMLDEKGYKTSCVQVSIAASVGSISVYLLAPVCIASTGWQMIFLIPAGIGILTAIIWYVCLGRFLRRHETIRQTPHQDSDTTANQTDTARPVSLTSLIAGASLVPVICAIILHGTLRDGITTWMPAYIIDTFGMSTSFSILTTALLPLFSIFSISFTSFLLEKLKNELLTATILFGCASLCAAFLLPLYDSQAAAGITLMMLMTGCMHGVNLLLISRIPRHFARYGRVATVSGLLNASTYIGSALSSYMFASLSQHLGWFWTIVCWLGIAAGGTLLCAYAIRRWSAFCHTDVETAEHSFQDAE